VLEFGSTVVRARGVAEGRGYRQAVVARFTTGYMERAARNGEARSRREKSGSAAYMRVVHECGVIAGEELRREERKCRHAAERTARSWRAASETVAGTEILPTVQLHITTAHGIFGKCLSGWLRSRARWSTK